MVLVAFLLCLHYLKRLEIKQLKKATKFLIAHYEK